MSLSMGRKSTISEAITIPNDGVIYYSETKKLSLGGVGISQAQEILKNNSDTSLTSKLWSSLLSAKLNQEQLQSLQAYRSSLINIFRAGKLHVADEEIVGSYRLLLELSLSSQTNQPTRRAIRSILVTLRGFQIEQVQAIEQDVLSSIWNSTFWENSIQSMFEAFNYEPLESMIVQDHVHTSKAFGTILESTELISSTIEQKSLYTILSKNNPSYSSTENIEAAIPRTIEICTTLKVLLTLLLQRKNISLGPYSDIIKQLNNFVWKGITCEVMHPDGLSKLGVCYGQTFFLEIRELRMEEQHELTMKLLTDIIDDNDLPSLNKLCIVQGVATVLPDQVLTFGKPDTLLEKPVSSYLLQECNQAIEGVTRLFALRSLQTLLNRCTSIVKSSYSSSSFTTYIGKLSEESLKVTMSAWENPPGRQVASAIPGLFNNLVALVETAYPEDDTSVLGIKQMVGRVLAQPVNRKGRYIALETLLPIIGAKALMESNECCLIESLVDGVGDRAHTAGNIATLLGKILAKRKGEMYDEAGIELKRSSKKQRRKISPGEVSISETLDNKHEKLLQSWIDLWAPHFAKGLLSKSQVRRKQISALCVPLIMTMTDGPNRGIEASFSLFSLLSYLDTQSKIYEKTVMITSGQAHDAETENDIALWAKLEIARQASTLRVLSNRLVYPELITSIAHILPENAVRYALTHHISHVRLASFEALEAVTTAWSLGQSTINALEKELSLWRYALPYAFKSTGKEYVSSLLKQLMTFLNRLSSVEAEETNTTDFSELPKLLGFVNGFLIQSIVLKQAAYPGTVAEKEQFALSLLKRIVTFALGEDQLATKASQKKRLDIELLSRESLLKQLLSIDMMSMLLTKCHSMWDGTRTQAFECLTLLVGVSQQKNIALPFQFTNKSLDTRGLFLSSSPRQREADTGALILCFSYSLEVRVEGRKHFIHKILNILDERIQKMKSSLDFILNAERETDTDITKEALDLPLAHGLICFIRLFVEKDKCRAENIYSCDLFTRIINICHEAIEICLSVVADVHHGENFEDHENTDADGAEHSNVPLNVNTGAIGANATFSSIHTKANTETLRRFATQRVVMGSWLLVKEACATLSSAVAYDSADYLASYDDVMNSGQLLITTMTALKHQGAAYAAQKALQKIVHYCICNSDQYELKEMPSVWANRLLLEISSTEKVRDSTLRRSTGYALGFLSLMRPELTVKPSLPTLCPLLLSRLLKLSLPSSSHIKEFVALFGTSPCLQAKLAESDPDLTCSSTARVHAFNILRLIILDAPLASQVGPVIGDCLVSAIMGYSDDTWAVRNSATMVFSAAMLRVVDSDKNANQKDKACGNAITALEFFRQYAFLRNFFLAILQPMVTSATNKKNDPRHSPLILVLLLLARIQPIRKSGSETTMYTDSFIPHIIQSLSHNDHKVRVIAARALANLATTSDSNNKTSYIDSLLEVCANRASSTELEWNANHGALLGIIEIFRTQEPSSLPTSKSVVESSMKLLFQRKEQIPPSLLALALEIKTYYLGESSSDFMNNQENLVLSCLEISKETAHVVGAADLGCVIGRVAAENLSDLVWDISVTRNGRYIELLNSLLMSPYYDIRLTSTKAFKKKIYAKIDTLLKHEDKKTCVDLLEAVSCVLVKALTSELETASSKIKHHPPTVRRLSRCLLECLYASRVLDHKLLKGETLWRLAKRMMCGRDISEVDPDDKINGNCLEIMAFSFPKEQSSETNIEQDTTEFVSLAQKLNDSLGPWRVRHSVARAIDASSLLQTLHDNTTSNISLALHREVLKLLQDSDPDVRFVAASCVRKDQGQQSLSSSHTFALEQAYFSIGSSSGKNANCLLLSFLDRYRDIPTRMQPILDELHMSISDDNDIMDPSVLLNTGTSRKIFEDEEPNSYEEPLLALHLAVFTIIKFGLNISQHDVLKKESDYCADLADGANYIIDILAKQCSNCNKGGILHDATRHNSLFVDIQGILLACITIVYLGLDSSSVFLGVQQAANSFVSQYDTHDASHGMVTLHPEITKALQVLATAKRDDTDTRSEINCLCFLVPSNCSI